jgi:hypothetical protein
MDYLKYQETQNKSELVASVINAVQAILAADCIEAHKKDLLDICIWKWTEIDGKWNTRYRSEGAMKKENWKVVQHEHVFQRKNLIQLLLKNVSEIKTIMENAIGCLVTKDEHELLTRISKAHTDIDGWERYKNAGIPVYDLKENKLIQY